MKKFNELKGLLSVLRMKLQIKSSRQPELGTFLKELEELLANSSRFTEEVELAVANAEVLDAAEDPF